MDTEPGRCRRTDGKKWRCKLAVLPNQKYCERHVHRGRERSRKHVEVNITLLKSKLMSKSTTMTSISSLKITPNLESDAKTTNAINHNKVGIKNESFKIKKHSWEKAGGPLELTFGESVLQHGTVRGCGTTSNKKTGVLVVAKSKKCRKTDGKKWQCSKEAVSEQKYCVEHIQRGAKKVENGQKANTGLSFLVGASYQQMNNDGMQSNDDSCSSSDATTVSV